jgi:hypothetical protein
LIDAGRDVVAVTRHDGTGRASGVTVEDLVADVVTVEDGTLVRIRIFNAGDAGCLERTDGGRLTADTIAARFPGE